MSHIRTINSFEVLKQYKSDFQAKIHEALLIKKHRPSLNKQLQGLKLIFLTTCRRASDIKCLLAQGNFNLPENK